MTMSLRRLLSMSMLLLLAAAIGMILITIQLVAGASLEKDAVDRLRATASAARERIDQEMYERLRDVALAAESLQGERVLDMKRGRILIDGLAKNYPDYSWVSVTDRNGIVRVGTKGMLEGQSVAARPWFPQGLKGPYVGDFHEAVLLGQLMGPSASKQPWRFVDFAVPLTGRQGQVVGVFGAHLNWEWATNILRGFESPPESGHGREVFILDSNGLVLYGPQEMRQTRLEVPADKDVRQTWKIGDQWLMAAEPSQGYRDYKGLGWTVVVRESMVDVLAPVHQMRMAILAWALPMLAIFLIAAMFISRWIARPLEALNLAAGQEHFLPMLRGGSSEIARLNESLRGMVERLANRKQDVEREVKARTAEIKHLTEALDAHAIVSMADAVGNITYVNEKFCTVSGYSAEELIGQNHRILKSGVHSDDFYQDLWHTITNDQSWQGKICNRKKDGDVYWVQSTITPTQMNAESPHRYISIRTDITDVIKEQEARRAAEMAADRANRAKSEFLSNMSHELRTPLNSILGFAQILENSQKHPLDQKQKEHVQQILGSGQHLLDLINEVLDLARIEAGGLSLSIEPVKLADLLEECLSVVQGQAQKQEITLIPPLRPAGNIYVKADRIRLKQVLLNLLSNAIKYNRANGTVTLSVTPSTDGRVCIAVEDTGLGIPQEKQSELFTPFHRLGAERSEIEGTGIGLTISQRLIQAMNGMIGFSSQPGEGSTFWVALPVDDSSDNKELAGHEGGSIEPLTNPGSVVHKILYIEDNPSNVELLESLIEETPGLEMVARPNAEQGLDWALRERPDLILLDINLPGMSGIEAMRRLKSDPKTQDIPVLALSADATRDTIREALKAGFLDYVTKPIDVSRLTTAIRSALQKEIHD